jgi:hypothetical protein
MLVIFKGKRLCGFLKVEKESEKFSKVYDVIGYHNTLAGFIVHHQIFN